MSVCIFCHKHESRLDEMCTYGLKHELPEVLIVQKAKVDVALCVRCGLHPKNPVSKTNGCEHAYA